MMGILGPVQFSFLSFIIFQNSFFKNLKKFLLRYIDRKYQDIFEGLMQKFSSNQKELTSHER